MFTRTKTSYATLVLLAAAFPLLGHGAAHAQSTLPEMSRVERNVGYQYLSVNEKGEETTTTLVAQTNETIDWKRSDGTAWTSLKLGFAPTLKWSGFEFADGGQNAKLVEGQPYPLKVGNTWTYLMDGWNANGSSWTDRRTCKVEGVVKVTIQPGAFDTFEVICEQKRSTRKFYMSPELGLIRFWRNHTRRGTTSWDLVKVISAGSP